MLAYRILEQSNPHRLGAAPGRYPSLRVAYIDGGGKDRPQWSTLIRGSGRFPQGDDGAVDEVYR